jgi:DNA-binding LacI/PurR family transcriptional regulator
MTLPGRPIVLIDCSAHSRPCRCGAPREGARVLVEHLITVHGTTDRSQAANRAQILASKDGGTLSVSRPPPGPIIRTNFSYRGGRGNQRLLMADPATRDLAAADQLGIGALKAIRQGIALSEDIGVVCYDGTTESILLAAAHRRSATDPGNGRRSRCSRTQLSSTAIRNRAHHS